MILSLREFGTFITFVVFVLWLRACVVWGFHLVWDSNPEREREREYGIVSLFSRKQGGAPFPIWFTKWETPLGWWACTSPEALLAHSCLLFCALIFGAPTEEGCAKTLSVLSLGLWIIKLPLCFTIFIRCNILMCASQWVGKSILCNELCNCLDQEP